MAGAQLMLKIGLAAGDLSFRLLRQIALKEVGETLHRFYCCLDGRGEAFRS